MGFGKRYTSKEDVVFTKRILITGAAGFIGANLLRVLILKGANDIHIFIRKTSKTHRIKDLLAKVKVHYVDITDNVQVKKIVHKIKPQVIFHCAMYGGYPYQKDEDKIIITNVSGTRNLISALSDIPYEHFINVGSSSEYGLKSKPMKESDACEPISVYGMSKLMGTLHAAKEAVFAKKPITTVRIFSAFGPYEDKGRFIPLIIDACIKDKQIEIRCPNAVRDYLYVEDIVNFLIKVSKRKRSFGIINIGCAKQRKAKEVVAILEKITKKKIKARFSKKPLPLTETLMWQANMCKAKKIFGKLKFRSFEKGLRDTIKWYKEKTNA